MDQQRIQDTLKKRNDFRVFFESDMIGRYSTLAEAQKAIRNASEYKKTWFTKKGTPSAQNSRDRFGFSVYDNMGDRWSIRNG